MYQKSVLLRVMRDTFYSFCDSVNEFCFLILFVNNFLNWFILLSMTINQNFRRALRNSYGLKRFAFKLAFNSRSLVFGRLLRFVLLLRRVTNRPVPLKIVYGWRSSRVVKVPIDYCILPLEELEDWAPFQGAERLSLAGLTLLPKESLVSLVQRTVQEKLPLTWPLELFLPFVADKGDGNFNSVALDEAKPNLETFRRDGQYHFLTSDIRVRADDSEQFKRLLAKGYERADLLGEIQSLDRSGLNSAGPHENGEFLAMDIAHHYYFRKLETFLSDAVPATILEIGGGYGGLCRQVLTFASAKVDYYVLIDIPVTLALAQECLRRELTLDLFHKIVFIEFQDLQRTMLPDLSGSTIGVATHSLSELDPEIINSYLHLVVPKCSAFLIAMQRIFQNKYNSEWLYRRLLHEFCEESVEITEGMNVVNATLVRN